ncbi:MAG: TrkA family potassium uptake protein [Propionibacteriaceae bacterium]|nr:TrkA family potassium uptake protein [Propionibacteriaceae bacterium]
MRIAIAGAGNVGRSIARELLVNGHEVLLIDKDPQAIKPDSVPEAEWLLADACEMSLLEQAGLDSCDVAIAATGDDKANLVHSLLAKTEFAVPRTVGRVNHPGNEWMFDEVWGVDVSVSTPRIMSALVEEAVTVGDLVRLFTFKDGRTNLVEMTLPDDSPWIGRRLAELDLPGDSVMVAIIRDGHANAPDRDAALEGGDELLFVTPPEHERALADELTSDEMTPRVVTPPTPPENPQPASGTRMSS